MQYRHAHTAHDLHRRFRDGVHWGIIGCGNVCEKKSGPALQQARHSTLVAVMRRSGAGARDFARRHDVPRWYDDASALVNDPGVNAIYVATPPDTHCTYACMAMQAGKPVYVEKPMALHARQARHMLAVAARTGMPLFVAYYRRGHPRFCAIKKHLDNGDIGSVHHVDMCLQRPVRSSDTAGSGNWRLEPSVGGGGYFVDLGSHTLDILDYCVGPVREAVGLAFNRTGLYRAEDTVSAAFRFAGNVQGSGQWSFDASHARDRVTLWGTRGSISFPTFGTTYTLQREDTDKEFSIADPSPVQLPLVQQVVDTLRGEGSCVSTGLTAMRTDRVIDAVLGRTWHGSPQLS